MKYETSTIARLTTLSSYVTLLFLTFLHLSKATICLIDGAAHTISVETAYGFAEPLVQAGTIIPYQTRKAFTTIRDGQTSLTLQFFAGDRPLARMNHHLATMTMNITAPGAAGQVEVYIQTTIGSWGKLHITASIPPRNELQIEGKSQMSQQGQNMSVTVSDVYWRFLQVSEHLASDADKDLQILDQKLHEVSSLTGWTPPIYELEKLEAYKRKYLEAQSQRKTMEVSILHNQQLADIGLEMSECCHSWRCAWVSYSKHANDLPPYCISDKADKINQAYIKWWTMQTLIGRSERTERGHCVPEERTKALTIVTYDIHSGIIDKGKELTSIRKFKPWP